MKQLPWLRWISELVETLRAIQSGQAQQEKQLLSIQEEIKKMAATLDQLSADFATFQGDFSTFVTETQAALQQLAAGGLTPAQQAQLDTIDSGLTSMDATVKGIVFPPAPAAGDGGVQAPNVKQRQS